MTFFMLKSRNVLLADPYKSISHDAVIIIESPDLQSFMNSINSGKGISGEVEKIKELSLFNSKIKFYTDLINKPEVKQYLESGSSLISFYQGEKGSMEPLFAVAVPGDKKLRHLKTLSRTIGFSTINDILIGNNKVIELPFQISNDKDTIYTTIKSGLFLFSTSKSVLTDALEQTDSDIDIRSLQPFSTIQKASGKNETKVYILFENLEPFLGKVIKKEATGIMHNILRLAGCIEGDIYLDNNSLVLSGYAETTDSTDVLYHFKEAKGGTLHSYRILPASTVLFETIILPEKSKPAGKYDASSPANDLATSILPYLDEEVTKAYLGFSGGSVADNIITIYELRDRVFAEKVFNDLNNKADSDKDIYWFRPDDQISIPIFLTSFKGFGSAMLPGFASGINDSCFVFLGNFMITGSSSEIISKFLYDNILNKTLANDIQYRQFESSLPSVASYFFFCVPSGITEYFSQSLNDEMVSFIINNRDFFDRIQGFGLQLINSNQMIYSTLSVQFTEEVRSRSKTEWETLLDTAAAIKPFFFINHTTGAREIFIQDLKNNGYLINSTGRVLWKIPLNEKINGQVYSIDYYRNGKFQLLFAGKNYLHLIDRNGNYVERYPVRLRSSAASPLALFYYDNNLDYRLLIAGEDKVIYAYDKTGNTIKGWKSFKTNGTVLNEISWFRVSGKDFIVASDEASFYLLDRTGNVRLRLKEPVVKSKGSSIRLSGGSEQYLVCTSPDGTVQHIKFDGSVTKFSLKSFSVDHSFDFFDIDGDGYGEYIFIDKGMLYLYDHNRTGIFTKEFGSSRLGGPICFTFSSGNRKIGVFDMDKNQIYLVDKQGKIMNGFPLRGASMFSIGRLSDKNGWNLIVGGTDNFLYNYNLNVEF